MSPRSALIVLILAGLGLSPPVHAQPGSVRFDFEGPSLRVEVETGGAAGSAEVVDGSGPGVHVADRSGGSALSLADGILSLENRSGSPADYLITVPQHADVALSIDGRTVLTVAAAGGGRQVTWRWPGSEGTAPATGARAGVGPADRAVERATGAGGGGDRVATAGETGSRSDRDLAQLVPRPLHTLRVNAYLGELIVDSIDVLEHTRLRAIKIIVGGDQLRVSGDRSVRFHGFEKHRWGMIEPTADSVEVRVELPADLERYHIRVGGVVIWELRDGDGRAHCEPVAEILAPDGRWVWLFTFIDGQLNCRRPSGPQPA